MRKLEFCGEEWLEAAQVILAQLVRERGAALGSETFSACQTYSEAPSHLRRGDDDSVCFTLSVGADHAEVSREPRNDVDQTVRVAYGAVLPRARLVHREDADEAALSERVRINAAGEGDRRGDLGKLSPAMIALLREFHNRLAAVTA